jgi:hypothetical protein
MMYQGQHKAIMAAVRGGAKVEPVVEVPPAFYLDEKEMEGLRFIRWLLQTGRISK